MKPHIAGLRGLAPVAAMLLVAGCNTGITEPCVPTITIIDRTPVGSCPVARPIMVEPDTDSSSPR
ncbi:MAG: hypothetical protein ACT4O1_14255 [Gemmatimonadota bacterium]